MMFSGSQGENRQRSYRFWLILWNTHRSYKIRISMSSTSYGTDHMSWSKMPFKPHEWPSRLQTFQGIEASELKRLGRFRLGSRGFSRPQIKEMLSVKIVPYSEEGKNSININFLVRISRGHSWPLRPDAQGSKSFSPPLGPQETAPFWCGRPRVWARTSTTRRVVEKDCTKHCALIFWPLYS